MITMCVATSKNWVIGEADTVPWRIKADLIRLRNATFGHTVILGRKTYDSMVRYYDKVNHKMPGGVYIVVTRNTQYKPGRDKTQIAHSVQDAIQQAEALGDENIVVIGGSAIFEEMLPYTDKVYWTQVQAEIEGDSFFPELNLDDWNIVEQEDHPKDEKNEYPYTFFTLERKEKATS
jgi:dihydrofolate reductase